MDTTTPVGFAIPWVVALACFVLHIALPARTVPGYVRDEATGAPLRYRLNGLMVTVVLIGSWAALCATGFMDWGLLYVMRWESAVGACALGLIYTALAVFSEQPTGKPLALDIFLGRAKNPQYLSGRVDAKMFLYLFGAAMLALNILSFAMHHQRSYATSTNPGLLLHAGLLCWFLFDYLTFERVHLWTYDLFAERVGFKLGWGCLSFYPYFYAIGLWSVIDRPDPGASDLYLVLSAGVFFLGWALSRGANLQKFRFKTEPERRFLGIQPEVLTDGHRSLLCSGFWGLSRHINYLGEVLMASGLALSLGFPSYWVPWLYPLYYVLLLFPRERDDERRCREKYGALWSAYTERVPRRIIPWIY